MYENEIDNAACLNSYFKYNTVFDVTVFFFLFFCIIFFIYFLLLFFFYSVTMFTVRSFMIYSVAISYCIQFHNFSVAMFYSVLLYPVLSFIL